ncbi:MAG: lipid IV(A) 3-deoxy-D-manno-octulosonic acid transferase [Rugosibacter sp.]
MPPLIYTLATLLLLPWAIIHLLWRARRQPGYLQHWGERFGFFSAPADARSTSPTLWLHAVSVGETRAAQPLVAALRERYPAHRILFTHMTPTGRTTSQALFGDTVERIYLPYDTPWAMRRFLRHYRPEFGCILETELWPNLLAACQAQHVPVFFLNARLSARSARRYAWFPNLTRQALRQLGAIGAQSADDAARLTALGATSVTITGNMKFDIDVPPAQLALGQEFRARIGARPVWLAASTREGEEALILDAWKKVLSPFLDGAGNTAKDGAITPNPLLIIVPRHPQRFDEVAQLAIKRGFLIQRRSENTAINPATQVLIGDSMGEMFVWYAAADLAFIGGSLKDYGSQNLIEACAAGTPVLLGPSTFNFAEAASAALACGAAYPVRDADDLVRQVATLLANPERRQRMGKAGLAFATRHRGATVRALKLISPSISSTAR